ncbi:MULTISPECIES: division plane positioning ATPase MipZ [unclassified Bradyrhizobium]|uniref:division plane positioning ATPase MipZ n=1 Tax=unclassified Bradyrhizobium TaxID=2631580 RepID=UPI00247A8068|nr:MULTISPECIES: division plane positioning ATPase MipZ [unclassified Bradyrhizobium]WGR72055.1 division plane positioning ATPase MipZ [Bradyrhizobium sp. ISRA426]WGR76889.1 division plane positioning ATPase MipZ [Bradyrhizobium sp. ISRA430]WGR87294.1 division plane positioning ATPase MipZ [Bradyrhizobium sp. ISRA432]
MLHATPIAGAGSPYVIVIGNEKGGSGKTTIAMHLAVALLKEGHRVGTIDLDSNQGALTRYIENRRIWAWHRRIELELPPHRLVRRAEGANLEDNEVEELVAFQAAVSDIKKSVDLVVIDTPSTDTYLMRLAHLVADTLVTPVTDSFLDFGTLASVDPITHEVTGIGHYAEMVCEARRHRREFDQCQTDWVVLRNRSARGRLLHPNIAELGIRLGLRDIRGCAERSVYRQLFPSGLTALDALDEATFGARPGQSHRLAQQEMRDLVGLLNLPITERACRRAAARKEWFASARAPLGTNEVLLD